MVLNQLRIYSLKLVKKIVLGKARLLMLIKFKCFDIIFFLICWKTRPTVVDIESDIGLITCSSGTTGPSKCKLNSILLLWRTCMNSMAIITNFSNKCDPSKLNPKTYFAHTMCQCS